MKTMRAIFYVVLSILFFLVVYIFLQGLFDLDERFDIIGLDFSLYSLNGKTEIVKFKDPGSRYVRKENMSQVVCFVISNPPENKDSLLNLVYKHFQSYAPVDTIEKYNRYAHTYYKETWYTHRSYKEKREGYSFYLDYLNERRRRKDLLIIINVEPKPNKQEITFYKKWHIIEGLVTKWRDE